MSTDDKDKNAEVCPDCLVDCLLSVDSVLHPKMALLAPNPQYEEERALASSLTEEQMARIRSYNAVLKYKKKFVCKCQEPCAGTGIAPLVKLNSKKDIPTFGLGTWLGFGKIPSSNDSEVEEAVKWAIDAGYRHIDTAAIYNTEEQVGRAIKQKIKEGVVTREELFITTKLWNDAHGPGMQVPELRKSLKRLGLDYVDLYLIHWPVGLQTGTRDKFENTDYLETWKGMQAARDQCLTKSIGVCNFNKDQLERLITLSSDKPAVLQVEINLNLQQPALLSYCKEQNIVVMGYTPFGSIFHSKAAPDAPPPRTDDLRLNKIAKKYKKTVPQVVLRYLVELGVIPIPKSVTKQRIEQNIQVFDFKLTREEFNYLKTFDTGYRTIPAIYWKESPYYPFEKDNK